MPEQGQVADEKQLVERRQLQRQLAGQGNRWNRKTQLLGHRRTGATAKTGETRGTRARGRTGAIGGTGVTT